MQYLQERVADAAIASVTSACTLSRWDRSEALNRATPAERSAAELYLRMANRRFDESLRAAATMTIGLPPRRLTRRLRLWTDYQASR